MRENSIGAGEERTLRAVTDHVCDPSTGQERQPLEEGGVRMSAALATVALIILLAWAASLWVAYKEG